MKLYYRIILYIEKCKDLEILNIVGLFKKYLLFV